MKYYQLPVLNNSQQKFGLFLNDYQPYQEIRDFRHYDKPFLGFSNNPIIFERSNKFENNDPISDFLLTDWAENIVSKKVYELLSQNYGDEIDFYPCFVKENNRILEYYIMRPKYEIDCLDRKNSIMGGILGNAIKCVIDEDKVNGLNCFSIKNGVTPVISEIIYKDLKKIKPSCFEPWRIKTTAKIKYYTKHFGDFKE
jgi:hypothetical protein